MDPPPAVRPLMVLELGGKNEHVARNERKPLVSNFMVLGQPVTTGALNAPVDNSRTNIRSDTGEAANESS